MDITLFADQQEPIYIRSVQTQIYILEDLPGNDKTERRQKER